MPTLIAERCDNCFPKSFVYFNLDKGCWSVRIDGLVAAHAKAVVLECCSFKVSEKGRQRVIKKQRKNVHAGVSGLPVWLEMITIRHQTFGLKTRALTDIDFEPFLRDGVQVTYNPYKAGHFTFVEDGSKVTVKDDQYVVLGSDRKVWLGQDLVYPKTA